MSRSRKVGLIALGLAVALTRSLGCVGRVSMPARPPTAGVELLYSSDGATLTQRYQQAWKFSWANPPIRDTSANTSSSSDPGRRCRLSTLTRRARRIFCRSNAGTWPIRTLKGGNGKCGRNTATALGAHGAASTRSRLQRSTPVCCARNVQLTALAGDRNQSSGPLCIDLLRIQTNSDWHLVQNPASLPSWSAVCHSHCRPAQ